MARIAAILPATRNRCCTACGLEMITQVTCNFVRAAMAAGCAGIFFATQDATHQAFDEAGYRRYAEPYDHRVLHAARDPASGGRSGTA